MSRARREALAAAEAGFEELCGEQERFWAAYWDTADIEVSGNVADQQALRFCLFHLRQSNPEDDRRSIGANAMTGDHYRGHVFWDTEMYLAPHFLYTEPKTVRSLLMYRYNILDMARRRAREMGGEGALYAWNSISGEECGVVFEASTAEYHLMAAIGWAVYRYVEATDDRDFLFNYGAEMLFETARFYAGRGCFVPARNGAFCINVVCGPDEYGCGVNNNCYTNVMAQWHLRYAAAVYERMGAEAPESLEALAARLDLKAADIELWKRAADHMYVPFNAALGIHEQDDSFLYLDPVDMSLVPRNTDIRETVHPLNLWRMQVVKQADVVLLMFVQGHQFTPDVKRANYEFYEPRTCHGSSLSACMHAIVAAEIGLHDDAYAYFRESVMMDLNDFKDNTGGGMHAACLGGTWMAVVNGFAGMRDYPDGLRFAPRVPAAWKGYRCRVLHRGSRIELRVGAEGCEYRLIDGPAVRFTSGSRVVELTPENPRAAV
jgi:alpha,alpha-trehalose phosphorylase